VIGEEKGLESILSGAEYLGEDFEMNKQDRPLYFVIFDAFDSAS